MKKVSRSLTVTLLKKWGDAPKDMNLMMKELYDKYCSIFYAEDPVHGVSLEPSYGKTPGDPTLKCAEDADTFREEYIKAQKRTDSKLASLSRLCEAVESALLDLDSYDHELIYHCYREQLNNEELSAKISLSRSAIYQRKNRIYDLLSSNKKIISYLKENTQDILE